MVASFLISREKGERERERERRKGKRTQKCIDTVAKVGIIIPVRSE